MAKKIVDGPIESQLRAAAAEYLQTGTMYTLAKATGVGPQVIGRWIGRERDIRLKTADRLAQVLLGKENNS